MCRGGPGTPPVLPPAIGKEYMKLIDTHTHPFDGAFDDDRSEAVERALEAGVCRMMCPAIDSASHEALFRLCDAWPEVCLPLMGLHPTSVNDIPDWLHELEIVERYLCGGTGRRFYGVGEVGLDFYWSRDRQREQTEAFVRQVELSLRCGLPLVIHTRDAWPEMTDVLRGFRGRSLRGIMHAFSGTWEDYEAVRACGDFLFGIGGVVTYKKSTLPETVARIPLDELVLETDAPYLPPVPFRGKRNEPAYIAFVCDKVAAVRGIAPEEVAAATTANACRMFGIGV